MPIVAGIDSSTQSCKVVIRDADSGVILRTGRAPHPEGTEVDPNAWLVACEQAIDDAGGIEDVKAVGVGGQQHGLVTLNEHGQSVRPAMLWNDTRSANAAADLVDELGASEWANRVGTVPVASLTVTKLRWLAQHEPANLRETRAVCLPHDWLTWHLTGGGLDSLVTDRGDASGTGYWSALENSYAADLLELASGRSDYALPRVLRPSEVAGAASSATFALAGDAIVSAGTGDNMAAALAVGAKPGDVIISVGTSGVVSVVSSEPVADASGQVAGFADATGHYLPLVCTLNAGLVIEKFRNLLGVSYADFDSLALRGHTDSEPGPVLLPYLAGERTPNRPAANGVLANVTLGNLTRHQLAGAVVDSIACSLADGLSAITECGIETSRVLLIGGGAKLTSLRQALANVLGLSVVVPESGEYVAEGAAAQAAWALTGTRPDWQPANLEIVQPRGAGDALDRYHRLRDQTGPNGWPHD